MGHKVSISTDEIREIVRRQKAAKAARANALMAGHTRTPLATVACADSTCEATREGLTHSHLATV